MVLDIRTWEQTFQNLIQEVKPRTRWTLSLDRNLQLDCVAPGWKQHQQRAFGWFQCSLCRRHWASAQVHILCHLHWECRMDQGQVVMRLFGQRCQKCSWSQYEMPEFSTESTTTILNNLVQHILKRYYGDGATKFPKMSVIPEVPLEGSHDAANCEACALGICTRGLHGCIAEPLACPPSYLEIERSSPRIGDMYIPNQSMNQSAQAKEAKGTVYKGSVPSRDQEPPVVLVCILLLIFFLIVICFKRE
ncbi:receptor-transporting protein 4 [Nycticebus coucang]|uniref:receptor-transporting protein 4 n=1 Tax=Nycticebus coucang TaxID=9470 RepID=UPI00234DDD6B|nr:receptor-transporting protein 4 [Nycticebus coucang]